MFVGWNARCHKAIAEEDSTFVDEDGLFTEDEERKLLRTLTVSQSVYARSLSLNSCVESMEICGEELPVFNMDPERLGNFIRNREAGTEPVRVGHTASGGASVCPEAGEHHRATLAQVKSSSDLSTGTGQVMDLTHSTSESADSADSECPGF